MLGIEHGRYASNCAGRSRRTALKAGFLGVLGLSTADLLRLRSEGAAKRNGMSVILIWLDGGPRHMETYDPKPAAPQGYRSPLLYMPTNVPAIPCSEMLPRLPEQANHRSLRPP